MRWPKTMKKTLEKLFNLDCGYYPVTDAFELLESISVEFICDDTTSSLTTVPINSSVLVNLQHLSNSSAVRHAAGISRQGLEEVFLLTTTTSSSHPGLSIACFWFGLPPTSSNCFKS